MTPASCKLWALATDDTRRPRYLPGRIVLSVLCPCPASAHRLRSHSSHTGEQTAVTHAQVSASERVRYACRTAARSVAQRGDVELDALEEVGLAVEQVVLLEKRAHVRLAFLE